MPIYIALLRAVNVGGHNKIKMEDLRSLFESIGLKPAVTYIQSGNVVFKAKQKDPAKLAAAIEGAIEERFGFRSPTIVRSQSELDAIISRNPFAGRQGLDPSKLLVTFLSSSPGDEGRKKVQAIKTEPEELILDGREMFIYYKEGIGKSKLPGAMIERALGVSGTGRNWNTVLKLSEMANGIGCENFLGCGSSMVIPYQS